MKVYDKGYIFSYTLYDTDSCFCCFHLFVIVTAASRPQQAKYGEVRNNDVDRVRDGNGRPSSFHGPAKNPAVSVVV